MTTTPDTMQMSNDVNAMGSSESEDEWICNDDGDDSSMSPVEAYPTKFTFKQLQELDHLPNSPKISFEQLQGMEENLQLTNFVQDASRLIKRAEFPTPTSYTHHLCTLILNRI